MIEVIVAVRIFVVEDNELMREMLVEFLDEVANFVVCGSAGSAEKAFDQLADVEANLILIDMALPGMNGAELVGKLLERTPSLPCLLYSGHREISYATRALACGARGYVLKGSPEELPQAIHSVLRGEIYVSDALRET